MKKLVLMAFGLCMLAACSQDEVMEVNRNGDEITFDVVTNAATRAADVYCNNNKPSGFYVSAISDGKTYLLGLMKAVPVIGRKPLLISMRT